MRRRPCHAGGVLLRARRRGRLERKPAALLVKLAREGGGFEAYDARQK